METSESLTRTTHLAMGAHQDDIEFFAFHGIAECYDANDKHFTGVTLTDGSGSPRQGKFAKLKPDELTEIRHQEQLDAAKIGKYNAILQLDYSSREVKKRGTCLTALKSILSQCQANTVYIHNPFDRHPTHIASCIQCIDALRELPQEKHPKQLYGCEVWRDLDWLPEQYKITLPCSKYPKLQVQLNQAFRSQIEGGKRYDKAVMGRRLAHATFSQSHAVDQETGTTLAIDLMPLLKNEDLSITQFVDEVIDAFRNELVNAVYPC